jgi:hypothetical protein
MLDMIDIAHTIESVGTELPAVAPESQNEQKLGDEIVSLWSAHAEAKNTARATKDELWLIRAKLGERLHELKQVLAQPGRGGQWSGFLREHKIPRATADRLVARHLRSLNPDADCLNEAISEPTEEDVQKLFAAVWPKLRRTLSTRQSIRLFVDLLTSHFQCSEATDREILVLTSAAPTSCPVPSDEDSFGGPESSAPVVARADG